MTGGIFKISISQTVVVFLIICLFIVDLEMKVNDSWGKLTSLAGRGNAAMTNGKQKMTCGYKHGE